MGAAEATPRATAASRRAISAAFQLVLATTSGTTEMFGWDLAADLRGFFLTVLVMSGLPSEKEHDPIGGI